MVNLTFNWQLQRTGRMHGEKDYYVSEFKINSEWSLVCLRSRRSKKPEYLEIRRNSTGKEILISGTLILMDGHYILLQRKFIQLIEAGCATTLLDLNFTINYYHNPLRLRCDPLIYTISGTFTISASVAHEEKAKGVQFESLLNLSDDFECLLDPGATYFPDVELNCGIVSLPAHKSILSARSPVFAVIFTTQMKENRENKVSITDISPNVLKTMLTYIYTGKTGDLSVQSSGDLLFAADKYEILDLKRVCCDSLKSRLSAENALNTLVLGYLHDADLKVSALDFICNCCEDFQTLEKTAEWKNLRQKRPALAMDVLTSLVKSKDQMLKKNQIP